MEIAESKTRSEEGIIRSLRTCVQNHEARNLFLSNLRHLWENPFLRVLPIPDADRGVADRGLPIELREGFVNRKCEFLSNID